MASEVNKLEKQIKKKVISELGGAPINPKEFSKFMMLKADKTELISGLKEKANIAEISNNDFKLNEIHRQLQTLVLVFGDLLKSEIKVSKLHAISVRAGCLSDCV